MKKQVRVTAIDDGRFNKYKDKKAEVIAVTTRGPLYIEKITKKKIEVDGNNSTDKLIQLVSSSNHVKNSKAVLIHGTTLAGLNIIDLNRFHKETNKPVVTILRDKPNQEKIKKAIEKSGSNGKKKQIIDKNPKYKHYKGIHYSAVGINSKQTEELLETITYRGNYPEPLRISHIVASGVTIGD